MISKPFYQKKLLKTNPDELACPAGHRQYRVHRMTLLMTLKWVEPNTVKLELVELSGIEPLTSTMPL